MRIELSTLCAVVACSEQNVDEYEVVLSFGWAEIARWPIPPERVRYFVRGDGDYIRQEVDQFVAGKLAELFKIK